MGAQPIPKSTRHSTACNLCSLNCGIQVEVEEGQFRKVRGDENHPLSQGYLCQKAARLNYYQNHEGRLSGPLRKRPDGSFEEIDWDTAIREVAQKLRRLKKRYGGHSIAYYGGGGQGNHLGGAYAVAFREALQTPYVYNSLAQEKTGDFWVNGRLFGRQTCHLTEGFEDSDYAFLIGANPWQAHGISQARKVLKEIRQDPIRTLVVVDPRKTETAEMADIHLQVRPGQDAYLLAVLLSILFREDWVDHDFLNKHTVGFDEVKRSFAKIPVLDYCKRAGVEFSQLAEVARGLSQARKVSTRHDLGLEHSLHSTLNTYLEKLLAICTGNFGREGCNNLHTQFVPLIGHSPDPQNGGRRTRVTEMSEISKLFPPNILPAEIDNDHPQRIRAVFVDSANPILTAADTQAYRRAFAKLELVVVVDIAHTETAKLADYVLPASSQYEKTEATFFTLHFPTNYFHLRKPVVPPLKGTLSEAEIYARLVEAMKAMPKRFPVLRRLARKHCEDPTRGWFAKYLALQLFLRPKLRRLAPLVLYRTLGKALPQEQATAAVVWGASHFYARRYAKQVRRAGNEGQGLLLGEDLFWKILENDTAVPISTHLYEESWELIRHTDGKIHLAISELLDELQDLQEESKSTSPDFPFVLAAGERRTYNANQIYRDPAWRKMDPDGALRIHPEDAQALNLSDGDQAVVESKVGQVQVRVLCDKTMQLGCLSLPHGYGMEYADPGDPKRTLENGPAINVLTAAEDCDSIAKTPHHKFVPVRLKVE